MFSRRIQQRARQLVAHLIRPLTGRHKCCTKHIDHHRVAVEWNDSSGRCARTHVCGGLADTVCWHLDMFDGAMARVQNAATSFGAFLDSTLDRYSESIILFGLLWYALQHPGQHDQFWPAPAEQSWVIIFIFLAVVGSLLVSYTKARAEGLSIECKTGLLARPERVVILAIGLLSHTGIWALALLVVLMYVTAAERMFATWQGTRKPPEAHDAATPNAYEISTDNHYSPTTAGTNEAKKDRRSKLLHTSVPPFTASVQQD